MNTTGDDDVAIATISTDLHDTTSPNDGDEVACARGDGVDAEAAAAVEGLISISKPTTTTRPPPPPRRRSLRPSFEPERFVARPSRRGFTNADGDAIYLAGGVLVGGAGVMAASGNSSFDLAAAAGDADDIIDDSKHHPIKKANEDRGETERFDCDSEKLGKLPADTEAELTPASRDPVDHVGIESAPEPIMPPTQHSADAFSLSMRSEYSDMPQCSFPKGNVHNDDDTLGEIIQVDSISSTPVIEHDPKPSVTHSTDVDTESRYPKRTRITKSMREEWEDDTTGSSSAAAAAAVAIASTDYDGMLDFQISPTSVPNKECRAISCTKFSQGPHGLCYSHYSRYLMCTGQVKFWTCECGSKVKHSVSWCRNCRYSLKKGSPSNNGRKSSPHKDVVEEVEDDEEQDDEEDDDEEEEEEEEEVEFLRATSVARKEPRSGSNSTLRSDEHSRYPKRKKTRNLAEEITLSGLANDVPLSPRRTPLRDGKARAPNSSSSDRSSRYTQLDNMLDFSVSSPSTPFRSSLCRASSCQNLFQSKSNGFCRRHYNRYLICTGQAAWWTCGECGQRNIDISKRCNECHQKRNGASPMSSECIISPDAITKKAGKKREEVDGKTKASGRKRSAQLKEDERSRLRNDTTPGSVSVAVTKKVVKKREEVDGKFRASGKKRSAQDDDRCRLLNDTRPGSVSNPASTSSSGGIRSRQTYAPPELADQISPQRCKQKGRLTCKVITCDKFEQTHKDGFCSYHFSLFSLKSGGRADKRTNRLSSSLSTTSSSAPVSFANVPEVTLLERTRTELLNGRDYWICTDCAVEVSSITYPCGKCNKMISFVPLEMEEFEEFVHKQREMNIKKKQEEEQRQMKEICGAGGREH